MRFGIKPLEGIADLVLPRVCHVCGALLIGDDKFVCATCMGKIPRVAQPPYNPFATPSVQTVNGTSARLGSNTQIEMAVSWMYYNKLSPYAVLLRDFKYGGFSRLARFLGYQMAVELEHTGIFSGVDCIVPMPLHGLRLMRRGYNQTKMLALGIKDYMGLPIAKALKAHRHRSQTHLDGERRISNVKDVFYTDSSCGLVNPREPLTPRILLVDDVCTTGSTLSNAAKALCNAYPGIRIHVLTLALADS